jgi:hypothetical protein
MSISGSDLTTATDETQMISDALAVSRENISDFPSADPNISSSASEMRQLASTNFDPHFTT